MGKIAVDKRVAAVGGPRRAPSHGGYARGDDARQRLLVAALEVFRRNGYHRATTREIAAEAGMNTPALQYYFSSKLGVYRACIDKITTTIVVRFSALLGEGERLLAGPADSDDLIAYYCRLQDSLVDSFFAPYEGEVIARLLSWESIAPGMEEGQILMRDRCEIPIIRILAGIIGRLLRKPADDLEIGIHTFAATGMFRIFHVDGRRTQSLLGWSMSDAGKPELVKAILRQQSTALLQHFRLIGETQRARACLEDPRLLLACHG